MKYKNEAVSKARLYLDAKQFGKLTASLVEAGICLIIRFRFDKLNDQLVHLRQSRSYIMVFADLYRKFLLALRTGTRKRS